MSFVNKKWTEPINYNFQLKLVTHYSITTIHPTLFLKYKGFMSVCISFKIYTSIRCIDRKKRKTFQWNMPLTTAIYHPYQIKRLKYTLITCIWILILKKHFITFLQKEFTPTRILWNTVLYSSTPNFVEIIKICK